MYSSGSVSLATEVKGGLLVSAFDNVSEGSNAIFRVTLDANASGTSLTLGLVDGTANLTSDYGPNYTAYYYDNGGNKQSLTITNNQVNVPSDTTTIFVNVPTVNDNPKVYEGPESFSLTGKITGQDSTLSSDSVLILDEIGRAHV